MPVTVLLMCDVLLNFVFYYSASKDCMGVTRQFCVYMLFHYSLNTYCDEQDSLVNDFHMFILKLLDIKTKSIFLQNTYSP